MTDIVEKILGKMPGIFRPQFKFMLILFATILCLGGRMNFRNMSRHSDLSEKTFSRNFRKDFDFVLFNSMVVEEAITDPVEKIAAMDCTFVPKSGDKTYGLDYFWNGCADRSEKGLELSVVSVNDVSGKTAYTVSAMQTPPSEPMVEGPRQMPYVCRRNRMIFKGSSVIMRHREKTRIDFYAFQIRMLRNSLPADVTYVAVDGYYAKEKFVAAVVETGLHIVGKLRSDASLRYLYKGPRREGRGRPKLYDGKVDLRDVTGRMELVAEPEKGVLLYTDVVNAPFLKRNIRVAYLLDTRKEKGPRHTVFYSTDTEIAATDILRFYGSRFQIEFIFRDAKQHTGLCDCQATDGNALNFHFNSSLSALNLARAEDRRQTPDGEPAVFSMSSVKTRYHNEFLIDRIISISGVPPEMIKNHPDYEEIRNSSFAPP